MFPRIFAIGLMGLVPLLGSGCSGKSSNPQTSSPKAEISSDARAAAPTASVGADKDAKTRQVALAVTGMT